MVLISCNFYTLSAINQLKTFEYLDIDPPIEGQQDIVCDVSLL